MPVQAGAGVASAGLHDLDGLEREETAGGASLDLVGPGRYSGGLAQEAEARAPEAVSHGESLSSMIVMAWHPYIQQRLAMQKMLGRARNERTLEDLQHQGQAIQSFLGYQPQ